MNMPNKARIAFALLLPCALAACGNKGPLVRPDPKPAEAPVAATPAAQPAAAPAESEPGAPAR